MIARRCKNAHASETFRRALPVPNHKHIVPSAQGADKQQRTEQRMSFTTYARSFRNIRSASEGNGAATAPLSAPRAPASAATLTSNNTVNRHAPSNPQHS